MAEDEKGTQEDVIARMVAALDDHKALGSAVALAETRKDLLQHEKDISALKRVVYEQHEPVIIWCRNFMDSYRKIITAVIISGMITLIGILVQAYYMLQKGK